MNVEPAAPSTSTRIAPAQPSAPPAAEAEPDATPPQSGKPGPVAASPPRPSVETAQPAPQSSTPAPTAVPLAKPPVETAQPAPTPMPDENAAMGEADRGADAKTAAKSDGAASASGPRFRTKQGVNVRSGPGNQYERVLTVPGGAEGVALDEKNGWRQLRFDGGGEGWVYQSWLAPAGG
jgi:hypothetical protein